MDYVNSTYHSAATLLPYVTSLKHGFSSHGKGELVAVPASISLDPWSVFNQAWQSVMGYPAQDFEFVQGSTPMSTLKTAITWIATYYLIVFGGREIMRDRPAFQLKTAFIVHNWYLTMISGGLLVLYIQQLLPSLWQNGFYDNICGNSGWTDKLVILYYLNYLTKYLELLDTVFLVLKKKPLTFLHTYHHGATAFLCYTQLVGKTPVSWVPITLNLTVHVVMYWYYYQSAMGRRVWWKQYITMLQITQFVLDLGVIYFACWNYYASTYQSWLPHWGMCGHPDAEVAAFTGCAILSSYLVLFIMFYFSTYKAPSKPSTKKVLRRASKVQVPMVNETSEAVTDTLKVASSALVETLST